MFGDFLVSRGAITLDQLNEALLLQKFSDSKLGRLLVELGILKKSNLDLLLDEYLKPSCPLKTSELIEKKSTVVLPNDITNFKSHNDVYVIEITNRKIALVGKKFSDKVVQDAEEYFKREITLWTVSDEVFSIIDTEKKSSSTRKGKIVVSQHLTDEERLEEDNPYSKLIRESIDQALSINASDIHYESFEDEYIIRFRHHGLLKEWKALKKSHSEALTTKIKSIVNMDLALVGRPQDSRASFKNRKLDIRASSFPVVGGGEKIVLRLQRQDQEFILEELGLPDDSYEKVLNAAQKRDGLILISGPTGSGKTTTLYSLLCKIDKFGKNISTLENPVEKKLDRINQANISDYSSFADFQRALMRQDPDIILVGEVRDQESAELCMKLAATGHLVLSTIHANGAVEVVERLKNLGVDEFSIKSNLRLSIAQRLLRKLCTSCQNKADEKLVKSLLKDCKDISVNLSEFKITNKQGCEDCQNGVVGRVAVIEYLDKQDVKQFLSEKDNFKPSNSLKEESLKLALQGIVDVNEVIQIS